MNHLGLFTLVVFITAVTPGCGVLYTIHNACNYGVRNAVFSPCGNALGVATMSIIAASGLGALIQASPALFVGLQCAGALLMMYFGWKSWKAPAINLANSTISGGTGNLYKTRNRILFSAALLQVTNPMLIVFLLSLLPQFIDPGINYLSQITLLICIFVSVTWMVHIGYSYTAAFAATKFMGPKFSFWLNKISAVLFWLLGLWVFVQVSKYF